MPAICEFSAFKRQNLAQEIQAAIFIDIVEKGIFKLPNNFILWENLKILCCSKRVYWEIMTVFSYKTINEMLESIVRVKITFESQHNCSSAEADREYLQLTPPRLKRIYHFSSSVSIISLACFYDLPSQIY